MLVKTNGFTLVEVLLTLVIVGIVAAITLPTVVTNITERINSYRQANIAYKITQATDKMKALGLLNTKYSSTDEFVDQLQNHLKIIKRCNSSHINDCWPTTKVTTSDGKEYEVANAQTGHELMINSNYSDNVALVLADGASILLTYNQNYAGMDVGDTIVAQPKTLPVGFGKNKEFAYTTNTTSGIDFVMDVNGRKGPNSETFKNKYHDIRSFKAARFGNGCTTKISGIGCVIDLGRTYECINTCYDTTWDSNGSKNKFCSNNCWAGAKKACNEVGMSLPEKNKLNRIFDKTQDYLDSTVNYYWSSTESNDSNGVGLTHSYGKYDHSGAVCIEKK